MSSLDFFVLLSVLFIFNYAIMFLFFNRYEIGQNITTIMGRLGTIIGSTQTHYLVRFSDGTVYWCRPAHFKGNDDA